MTSEGFPIVFQMLLIVAVMVALIRALLPRKPRRECCECCLSHSFEVETPVV